MVKKGYKQTEVGVIPENWKILKIKDIGYLTSGESPSHFEFSTGCLPYFKVEQLNNSVKYQINTPYHTSSSKPIDMGSIIFPKRGAAISTNKVRLLAQPSLLDTNIMALTVTNGQVHNEYLFYWFIRKGLWQIADTTSVPQINNKHILPLQFPFPSFAEQERIADALSNIDSFLTALEKQISKKKAIKQGAMWELLTGKRRLPGFSGKWERRAFYDVCEICARMVDPTQKEYAGLPHIGNESIEKFSGRITHYNKAKDDHLRSGKYLFGSNDVLYGKINPHFAKAAFPKFEGLCSADMYPISCKDTILPEYLLYVLLSSDFTNYTISLSKRSGIPKVNRDELADYLITLPSLDEQKEISNVLHAMDMEIEFLMQKLEKYRQVKQGMMQQLLTGKIRLV